MSLEAKEPEAGPGSVDCKRSLARVHFEQGRSLVVKGKNDTEELGDEGQTASR